MYLQSPYFTELFGALKHNLVYVKTIYAINVKKNLAVKTVFNGDTAYLTQLAARRHNVNVLLRNNHACQFL